MNVNFNVIVKKIIQQNESCNVIHNKVKKVIIKPKTLHNVIYCYQIEAKFPVNKNHLSLKAN